MYCVVIYCIILYCIELYCIVLYSVMLCCVVLCSILFYCSSGFHCKQQSPSHSKELFSVFYIATGYCNINITIRDKKDTSKKSLQTI